MQEQFAIAFQKTNANVAFALYFYCKKIINLVYAAKTHSAKSILF